MSVDLSGPAHTVAKVQDALGELLVRRRLEPAHQLEQAGRSTGTPALAERAARLHHALTARWGPIPPPYAPAFNQP